jgi:hypothetical protein
MLEKPVHQRKAPPQDQNAPESEDKGKSLSPPAFQLKAANGSPEAPAQQKSNGSGLPNDLVGGFAASTGHDLSDVNVHRNSSKPAEVGALAYAQGNDIHLGAGQDQHLAHEAAHIVQQREGRVQPTTEVGGMPVNDSQSLESEADSLGAKAAQMKSASAGAGQSNRAQAGKSTTQMKSANGPIQRLMKSTYPWTGVIVNAWSAALRSSAAKDTANPHQNTIADIPKGTKVKVVGNTGNWLSVEVTIGGKALKGFVSQELVDDAVAASMTSMLGQEATWEPSGPGSGTSFEQWASAATEATAPKIEPATTINCWEMVLYAAYKAGVITWAWIHDLYVNKDPATWADEMSASRKPYVAGTSKMNRGDLVFFDDTSHVALATGKGDEILTFWPPPDKGSYSGTVDKVKLSTVKALSDYMTPIWGTPPVTYGPGAW